jgi:hypothetical protein
MPSGRETSIRIGIRIEINDSLGDAGLVLNA